MTRTTIQQLLGIGFLLFILGACSGGGEGQEPVPPPQAVNEPTDPPAEPPTTPPTTPPTNPPPKPPTTPPTSPPPNPPTIPREPPTPPPPTVQRTPAGIWHGQTQREGRTTLGMILPDGRSWFVFSHRGAPDWASGVLIGVMTVKELSWTMTDAVLVQKDLQQRSDVQGHGSWVDRQRLIGQLNVDYLHVTNPQPPLFPTDALDLTYDVRSHEQFSLTQAAGRYVGLFVDPVEEVEITLAANGTLAGRSATGCTFDGTVTPNGPLAEVFVTFDARFCSHDLLTADGVLHVDLQTGTLTTAAFLHPRQDGSPGLLFIGKR